MTQVGGDIGRSGRTNMTNFGNGCEAWIKSTMYQDARMSILPVVWTILYDQPKPLK